MITIGDSAFSGCTSLAKVNMVDSVTTIGHHVFANCISLEKITIPESVTAIGYETFSGCTGLTNVVIEDGLIEISDKLFLGCASLQSVTMLESVKKIGNYSFSGCVGLTEITLPDSIKSIGNYAFNNCTGLTGFIIPNGVVTIGEYAFYNCRGLTKLVIPDSVKSIGQYAFQYCSGLTSVTLPNGIGKLNYSVFSCCTGLKSITIPDSVTCIDNSAFSNCSSMTEVKLPKNLVEMGLYAFYSCSSLESVDIPYGITYINTGAFQYCTALQNVIIPNSVITIGESAFSSCSALKNINIPDSVTTIGKRSFRYSGLTNIMIPGSVALVVFEAFSDCGSLKNVVFCDGASAIDGYAFDFCKALESITIPESVTFIGEDIFRANPNVTIYGVKGSCAENYAKAYNRAFVAIDDSVAVTGVKLNKTAVSLDKGQTETLTATIEPANATDRTIVWNSGNTSVATVSNGKIKAVGAGKTTVTATSINGVMAVCHVTVTEKIGDLENSSTLSSEKINFGDTVTIKCSATGGTAPYQYQVLYKQKSSDKWSSLQAYSTNNTVNFKPTQATVYDICIKIKDSNNTEVKKYLELTVINNKLKNISALSASSIEFGKVVTVNAAASGSTGFYQYAVYTKKSYESTWSCKQSFSANPTVNVKPNQAASYDICVKVKDSKGTVAKKYFTLEVTEKAGTFSNTSTVSDTEIALGEEVTVSAAASGGTGFYQYAVSYKSTSESNYTTVQNYSDKNIVSVKPSKAATYDICVSVKDSSGKEVEKHFEVTVK